MTEKPYLAKVTTAAGDWKKALKLLDLVIKKKNTIPVLGCIRVVVEIDAVRIEGTDLDIRMTVPLPAVSEALTYGTFCCVSLHQMLQFASGLPAAEPMTLFIVDGNKATLQADGFKLDIATMPAADFPSFGCPLRRLMQQVGVEGLLLSQKYEDAPDWPEQIFPIEDPRGFVDVLDRLEPFISVEMTRYYLNGICFATDPRGRAVAVATNGHLLAFEEIGFAPIDRPIIHRKTVKVLIKAGAVASIGWGRGVSQIRFTLPGGIIVDSKTIDGTYPDWHRVLPSFKPITAPEMAEVVVVGPPSVATIDRASALLALKRVLRVAARKGMDSLSGILAVGRRGSITRRWVDDGNGGAYAEIAATFAGNPMDLGKVAMFPCNLRYLDVMLRAMSASEFITIEQASGGPMLFTAPDSKITAILMPMRMGEADEDLAARISNEEIS